MGPIVRNVYWWKPKRRFFFLPARHNVGDLFSPMLVERVLASRGITAVPPETPRLFAIGSILNHAQDGDVVWGSGHNGIKSADAYAARRLDIRAVRGPRTAAFLEGLGMPVPAVFGDPGILISKFWPREGFRARPATDLLVIPHFREDLAPYRGCVTALPGRDSFEVFIEKILSARLVISSSLHGLVFAESYGIPAIFMNTATTESLFKYHDYYEGTGRSAFPVARDLAHARTLPPAELPDLAPIQARLLAAFPAELWSRG